MEIYVVLSTMIFQLAFCLFCFIQATSLQPNANKQAEEHTYKLHIS
jgi:hypothetical protein